MKRSFLALPLSESMATLMDLQTLDIDFSAVNAVTGVNRIKSSEDEIPFGNIKIYA